MSSAQDLGFQAVAMWSEKYKAYLIETRTPWTAGRGTNMDLSFITLEVIQWVVIVVLVCLVVIEYMFISNLMEQIDLLSDRFLRLLNDQDQRNSGNHSLERIRSWRSDIRLKSKL